MTAFTELFDLASVRLGGAVLDANDEFFAQKENLLKPSAPVFLEHEYTDRGKWMDGWETRRRRTPGHDWALVRLGLPGIIRGFVVDTAFFRGNYPDACSIEACAARSDASSADLLSPATRWFEILPQSKLQGDHQNVFAVDSPHRVTHLRLNIFPDGGVARLRVHGSVVPDWQRLGRGGETLDLVAVENGGQVLACSDMFFGVRHNLVMPGRAANMGDGWETKRRRGPGHDWALVKLCTEAVLRRIEVDTNHFKGNYPDTCMIEGASATHDRIDAEMWTEVVPRTKLQANTRHLFEDEIVSRGPFTHLRLNIYPDGGVSRLRVWGSLTPAGGIGRRLARLNALVADEAERELVACCGSPTWAAHLTTLRPFASAAELFAHADAVWKRLDEAQIREAFLAHPRIGERKAAKDAGSAARAWSEEEQAGTKDGADATMAALAAGNRAYEEKFGHVFLICATGKSAEQILEALRRRLEHSPAEELAAAAEEQRQITRIRLEKMLG
jgi:allantoicase